jgi:hypothetical protein
MNGGIDDLVKCIPGLSEDSMAVCVSSTNEAEMQALRKTLRAIKKASAVPPLARRQRLEKAQQLINAAYAAVPPLISASFSLFQGRPEIVRLTASWCMDALNQLADAFLGRPLQGFDGRRSTVTLRKRTVAVGGSRRKRPVAVHGISLDAASLFYTDDTVLTIGNAAHEMKTFCVGEVSPTRVLQGADVALWPEAHSLWDRLLTSANKTCESLVVKDLMAEIVYQKEHNCEHHQFYISHGAPGVQKLVAVYLQVLFTAFMVLHLNLAAQSNLVIEALYPTDSTKFKLANGGATGLHVDKTAAANCAIKALAEDVPPDCVLAIWCMFSPAHFSAVCTYIWSKYKATCWRPTVLLDAVDFRALADLGVVPVWIFQRAGDIVTIPAFCIHLVFNVISNLKFAADSVSVWALRLQRTMQEVQVLSDGYQDLANESKDKKERARGEVGGSIAQAGILAMLRMSHLLPDEDGERRSMTIT